MRSEVANRMWMRQRTTPGLILPGTGAVVGCGLCSAPAGAQSPERLRSGDGGRGMPRVAGQAWEGGPSASSGFIWGEGPFDRLRINLGVGATGVTLPEIIYKGKYLSIKDATIHANIFYARFLLPLLCVSSL